MMMMTNVVKDNSQSWEPRSSFVDYDGTVTDVFEDWCSHGNRVPTGPPKRQNKHNTTQDKGIVVEKRGKGRPRGSGRGVGRGSEKRSDSEVNEGVPQRGRGRPRGSGRGNSTKRQGSANDSESRKKAKKY
jgi:hypothetical protein